ncbi:hypothetical protein AAVH_28625, partial [Aphelenchoides avenae]
MRGFVFFVLVTTLLPSTRQQKGTDVGGLRIGLEPVGVGVGSEDERRKSVWLKSQQASVCRLWGPEIQEVQVGTLAYYRYGLISLYNTLGDESASTTTAALEECRDFCGLKCPKLVYEEGTNLCLCYATARALGDDRDSPQMQRAWRAWQAAVLSRSVGEVLASAWLARAPSNQTSANAPMLTPRLKIVCPSLVRLKCSGHSSIVLWRVIDNFTENRRNTSSTTCSISRRNFWSVAARRRPEEKHQEDEAAILRSMEQFLVDESSCIRREFEPGTSKRDDLQSSTVVLEYFSSRVSPVSVQFLPYSPPKFHAVPADERRQSFGELSTTDTKRLYSKKAKPPSESPVKDELSLKKLLHLDAEVVKQNSKEAEISTSSPLFFPRSRSRQSPKNPLEQEPSLSASEHFAGSRKETSPDREGHKAQQRSQSLSKLQTPDLDGKHSQRPNLVVDSPSVNQRSTPPSPPPAMDGRLSLSSLFGLDPATTSSDTARRDPSPAATKASMAHHVSKPVAIRNAEAIGETQQRPTSPSVPRSDQDSQQARKPAEESDTSLASLFGLETTKIPSKTGNEAASSKSHARLPDRHGSAAAPGATKSGEERVERPSSARQAQPEEGQRNVHQSDESGEISLSSLFGLEPASSSTVSDKLDNKSVSGSGSTPRSATRPSSVPASPSQTPPQRPASARPHVSTSGAELSPKRAEAEHITLSSLFGVEPAKTSPAVDGREASSQISKGSGEQRAAKSRRDANATAEFPSQTPTAKRRPAASEPRQQRDAKPMHDGELSLARLLGVEPEKEPPVSDAVQASPMALKSAVAHSDDVDAATCA